MLDRRMAVGILAVVLVLAGVLAPMAGCRSLTTPQPNGQISPIAPQRSDQGPGGSGSTGGEAPQTLEQKSAEDAAGTGTGDKRNTTEQMLVRDKTLTMEVGSVRKALSKINTLASTYGASITNSNISSQGGGPVPLPEEQRSDSAPTDDSGPLSGTVTLKVPVTKFDAFATAVRKLGKVQSESESTEDVTQQHIDMQARLKNLRAEETAFVRFFRAAKNVRDMLAIERQLSRVRGEIESLQAQIDYLEKKAAMATLTVQLSEPGGVVTPSGQNWGFVDAITQAIRNFVGVINFLIMMSGALLPLLLLGLVGFWIVRWILRRFLFRRKASE